MGGGAAGLASDMARMQFMGDQRGREQIDSLTKQLRIKSLAEQAMALPDKSPESIMELAKANRVTPEEGKEVLGMLQGFIEYADSKSTGEYKGVLREQEQADRQYGLSRRPVKEKQDELSLQLSELGIENSRANRLAAIQKQTQEQEKHAYDMGRNPVKDSLDDQLKQAQTGLTSAQANYYNQKPVSTRDDSFNNQKKAQAKMLETQIEMLSSQRENTMDPQAQAAIDVKLQKLVTQYQRLVGSGGMPEQPTAPTGGLAESLSRWAQTGKQVRGLTPTPSANAQPAPAPAQPAPVAPQATGFQTGFRDVKPGQDIKTAGNAVLQWLREQREKQRQHSERINQR